MGRVTLVFVLTLVAACASPGSRPLDGGDGLDAGPDGSALDAQLRDAPGEDAPRIDAGRPPARAVQVVSGDSHLCVRLEDGSACCMGLRRFLGSPLATDSTELVRVESLGFDVVELSAGSAHTCARKRDGSVSCWGEQTGGALGDGVVVVPGSAAPREGNLPVEVVSANAVQLVSAGFSTCVRSAGGELSCWGWDQAHRFSDVLYQATPTLITSLGTTVRQAAVGNTLACVLRDDDTTWCWGDYIRSGTDEVHIASPTQVAPLGTDATEVTLNGHHVCARKSDGSAWCWGYNASGELGDGTMNPSDDPVMVMGLGTSVAHVCAGWSHSCALDTSGAVWCWGNGTVGQLGQGSTISSTVPMRLDLLGADVVDLACSGQATCARKSDESVWCWGGRIAPLFGMEGFGAALPTPTVIPESVECLPGPI